MKEDIVLDPAIRDWVLIPIVLITTGMGILRHYLGLLTGAGGAPPNPMADMIEQGDKQALASSQLVRNFGPLISEKGFQGRVKYLKAVLGRDRGEAANPMQDPSAMMNMMKGQMSFMVTQLVVGGVINSFFAGFLTTQLPFALTYKFKTMFQRGIALETLDSSWVSSLSWYVLVLFGVRGMYTIILGSENTADDTKQMQQMQQGGGNQDPTKAIKAEVENLALAEYSCGLERVEQELLDQYKKSA
eukprot:Clim_evm11s70 gene=Clim_evmTU11s70